MGEKSQFIRDAESIARALGLRLPKVPRKFAAALAPIHEAMRRADFPPPANKQGWREREAVLQWFQRNAELLPNKRGLKLRGCDAPVAILPKPKRNCDEGVAATTSDSKQLDLLEQIKDPATRDRIRLETLAKAHYFRIGRKPNESELAELRRAGYIQEAAPELVNGEYPKKVTGQPQIARFINDKFKIQCNRAIVQRWRKQAPEPFPHPDDRGEYTVDACFAWVEKWIIRKIIGTGNAGGDLDLYAQASEWEARGTIDREKHEQFLREQQRGKYVLVAEVESYIAGLAQRDGDFTDKLIEDKNGLRRIVREVLLSLKTRIEDGGLKIDQSSAPLANPSSILHPSSPVFILSPENLTALDTRLASAFAAENDRLKQTFLRTREELLKTVNELKQTG